MSKMIDISLPIEPSAVVWPGAPRTEIAFRRSIAGGDSSNNSNLFMNCHTGTHVDAPFHFIEGGDGVEGLSLEKMNGPAHVVDVGEAENITKEVLEACWPCKDTIKRVLFKTRNHKIWDKSGTDFDRSFCAVTESGARWLLRKNLFLIGIDYLSIQCYGDSPIVHRLLLEAKVVLLEGLYLNHVVPGVYELLCMPLNLKGRDGAPARVALRTLDP